MSIALLAIGDGRHEYHHRALASAIEHLPKLDHYIFVQDPDHQLGFAGAVREGWRRVLDTDARWVLHLELDFTFDRPIPVHDMVGVLEADPSLTQMALLRQPWNDEEKAAGSIFNLIRDQLTPVTAGGHTWLAHRRHWTTNPCVYPRWVAERGWPTRSESEGVFGAELLASDPRLRSAYWGAGEEWCTHVGDLRTGTGY